MDFLRRVGERLAAIFEISMSNSKYYIDTCNYIREVPLCRPESTRAAFTGHFCFRCAGVAQSRNDKLCSKRISLRGFAAHRREEWPIRVMLLYLIWSPAQ